MSKEDDDLLNRAYHHAPHVLPERVANAVRWSLGNGVMIDEAQRALASEVLALPGSLYTDRKNLNGYAHEVARANEQWWRDLDTGEPIERNKGEMLMLIVSEVAEAMEGARKSLMDDHLPHRKMEEVELTDALIRIFDYAAHMGFDLEAAYREKMAYNANRADHKPEARRQANGKKW